MNPAPNDVYALNAISFVTSMTYTSISCGGGDDISCEYLGCMSDWADNYDEFATIDDGSCYKFGCMANWANNYDELVTEDDGSCYRFGCICNTGQTTMMSLLQKTMVLAIDMVVWLSGQIITDPFATISYNNLPEEDTINTGSNMTVFIVSEL